MWLINIVSIIKGLALVGLLSFPYSHDPHPRGSSTPQVHTIEIKNLQFQPATLQVKKGDIVVWINRDIVAHDVKEEHKQLWASPAIATGKSWRLKVNQSADYFCNIHHVMKGKIVVQ